MASPPFGRTISFSKGGGGMDRMTGATPLPIIIVDGSALAYFLFQRCEACQWWDGGDLRAFDLAAADFVHNMRAAGVEMRVVFDGMVHPLKHDTVIGRLRDNAKRCESYLTQMRSKKGEQLRHSGFVLPFGIIDCLAEAFQREGVTCRRALYEADRELAQEYLEWSAKGAIGVLSNDSDFICMRVPLLPLNEIRLEATTFTAVVYEPATVAKSIGIGEHMLPMLACMAGNDYISRDTLAAFHHKLVPSSGCNSSWKVIRKISARLVELASAHEIVWQHGIDPPEDLERLVVEEMFAEQLQAAAATLKPQSKSSNKRKPDNPALYACKDAEGSGGSESQEVSRRKQLMAECTALLREARSAYSLHISEEVEGGAIGQWGQLAEECRDLRICMQVLQLAVHRQVWCRVAVECLLPQHRKQGAHVRCAPLRWCLAVLMHGQRCLHDTTEHVGQGRHAPQSFRPGQGECVEQPRPCTPPELLEEGKQEEQPAEHEDEEGGEEGEDECAESMVLCEFVQWGGDFRRTRIPWRNLPALAPLPPLPPKLPLPTLSCNALSHYRSMDICWRQRAFLQLLISRQMIGDAWGGETGEGQGGSLGSGSRVDEHGGGVGMDVEEPAAPVADGQGAEMGEEFLSAFNSLLELDPSDVLLCCALWLVVKQAQAEAQGSEAFETGGAARGANRLNSAMSHAQCCALTAAVSFPRDAFCAWLDAVMAKEAEEVGDGGGRYRLVIQNLNTCSSFTVVLHWVNALNDALAQPFPRQVLAVISPKLLLALQKAPGGVAAAMQSIWPKDTGMPADASSSSPALVSRLEDARAQWVKRYQSMARIVWSSQRREAGRNSHRKRCADEEHAARAVCLEVGGAGDSGKRREKSKGRGAVGGGGRTAAPVKGKRTTMNIFDALMGADCDV